ncbi:hypothetical protein FF38_01307 [Lucilia cuprina]|uniref:Uncharacterized protein n=1 Tax=Lucilia cuprina TaxID=7375 RepID=A0A0L0BUS8_LUCCU|nr:hypothetical protein FF38_01307 [Lucilia cuprina]
MTSQNAMQNIHTRKKVIEKIMNNERQKQIQNTTMHIGSPNECSGIESDWSPHIHTYECMYLEKETVNEVQQLFTSASSVLTSTFLLLHLSDKSFKIFNNLCPSAPKDFLLSLSLINRDHHLYSYFLILALDQIKQQQQSLELTLRENHEHFKCTYGIHFQVDYLSRKMS